MSDSEAEYQPACSLRSALDILAELSACRQIPVTSVDIVSQIIMSAKGDVQGIMKDMKIDETSKLSQVGSIAKHVIHKGGDVSTTCAVLLIKSEESKDLLRRRKMREVALTYQSGQWETLFRALAVEWTKSDSYEEIQRLKSSWQSLKQTNDVETYIAREEDLFECLKSYMEFAGITDAISDAERTDTFLRGLSIETKKSLAAFLREKLLRTEAMSYHGVVAAVLEVSARSAIRYSWFTDGGTLPKKIVNIPKTLNIDGETLVKCESCNKIGHESSKCWRLHPELRPTPLKQVTVHGAQSSQADSCPSCGRSGHRAEQCWKIHPELRPKNNPNPPPLIPIASHESTPRASSVPKAAPVARKPVTRSDTKKTFAVRTQPIITNAKLTDEIVVRAKCHNRDISMFIDTLSYFNICSKEVVESLGGKVLDLHKEIPVTTFDGDSKLTGESTLTLIMGTEETGIHEFDLKIHTVDRPLPLGSSDPELILGLASLQRMGADIQLSTGTMVIKNLDNLQVPLRARNGRIMIGFAERDENFPSLDEDPILFERVVESRSDPEIDILIANRLAKWVPLEAECRLKPNCPPQNHRGYPVPPIEVDNMTKTLESLVEEGVLIPTIPTPESFICPAFLRPKSDGGRRLVVNVKPLNNCQVIEELDLPSSLEGLKHIPPTTKAFACLDVSSAFHTVRYKDNISRKLHTICVMGKYYEYTRCVQGDANSPRWWSKHLEGLLQVGLGVHYHFWCIPYVDDILIYGETIEQCGVRFRFVKRLLTMAGKNISHEQFPCSSVTICGMEFSDKGWRMSDASREMLSKLVLKVPKTLNELRSGLGVMNYLRSGYGPPGRYFSDLTAPLFDEVSRANAIGKKNTPVDVDPETWSELNGAFRERFHSFTKFDSQTRFCITVDASDQFCGGTLSVRFSLTGDALEDPSHVLSDCNLVDTFSKRFSSSERNWAIFERESYAIYLALTRWAGILWQCPNEDIIVFTDSMVALNQWRNLKPPEKLQSQRRWIGWYEGLSYYDLRKVKFIHLSGESNTLADLLSRIVSWEGDPPSPIDYDDVSTYGSDSDVAPVLAMAIQPTHREDLFGETDFYKDQIRTLLEADSDVSKLENTSRGEDGLIYYGDYDVDFEGLMDSQTIPRVALYVPSSPLREQLISLAHGRGHSGWMTTYTRLREKFWWPGIRAEVKSWVKACGACALLRKEASTKLLDVQQRRTPVSDIFVSIFVDHFHGSGIFEDKLCLTVRDQFSGYTTFYNVVDETAVTTAKALLIWTGTFGCPRYVTSDRGPAYDSEVWRALCSFLKIATHYTAVKNPRANLSERPHRLLRLLCNEAEMSNARDWQEMLSWASLSWNNSRAAAIAPNQIVFGKYLADPFEVETAPSPELDQAGTDNDVLSIRDHLENVRKVHRLFQWDDFVASPAPPAPPVKVGDSVRDDNMRIGKVVECGTWACKVAWGSGQESWNRYGSVRLIDPDAAGAASSVGVTDFAVIRYDDDFFACKILEKEKEKILIQWLDNHGGATYTPLEGYDPEWISISDLVSYIRLTPAMRITEGSRQHLERLGIL